MREICIDESNAGQRFDKYLFKYFKDAPSSFIYKMLRKKNITLNNRKSDGKEILQSNDLIKIFMAEETIDKFIGNATELKINKNNKLYTQIPPIVYEDDNILIMDKPSGLLSQKDNADGYSVNEIAFSYLYNKGELTEESLKSFTPSICNRLDRNTSGIIIYAKKYAAAKAISSALRDRTAHKYYRCIVSGRITDEITLKGRLSKDTVTNKVTVSKCTTEGSEIETKITPIGIGENITYLEVLLITGKTHQIRAHLKSIGHPIIGDYKYGNAGINDFYKKKYGIDSQMLCAMRLELPKMEEGMAYLSNKVFSISVPNVYERVLADGNVEIKRT